MVRLIRRLFRDPSNTRRVLMLLRTALAVLGIGLVKLVVHAFHWELISVNPLFSTLVASTVFLFGFLLNGVLTDFKESEKLPGEIATSLVILSLEIRGIPAHVPGAEVTPHLQAVATLGRSLTSWARGTGTPSTPELMRQFDACHAVVTEAATMLQASLAARLMGEMSTLQRAINRIETIRETDFVPLVYWLAYAGTTLLCGGLVFSESKNILESFFFLSVISFLLLFLLQLIKDLDDPFGQADPSSAEDVDLFLLEPTLQRLERGV